MNKYQETIDNQQETLAKYEKLGQYAGVLTVGTSEEEHAQGLYGQSIAELATLFTIVDDLPELLKEGVLAEAERLADYYLNNFVIDYKEEEVKKRYPVLVEKEPLNVFAEEQNETED